jgi:hypothetical protein
MKIGTKRWKSYILTIAVSMSLMIGIAESSKAQAVLVRADLHTQTKNEDRDHDTGIFVQVTEADGHTTIAQIGNALACCG